MNSSTYSPFLYFQFTETTGESRSLQFVKPIEVLVCSSIDEVIETISKVQNAVQTGYYAAGYVSYEAAPAFDPAYKVTGNPQLPLVWFGIYESPIERSLPPSGGAFTVSKWSPNTKRTEYDQAIYKIKEAISRGDTYQTNYTIRLRASFAGDDFAFYQRLSAAQRADYAAYLNIGRYRILSASPELFFRREQNKIITRPMKGTIKRGRTLEEDMANRAILSQSIKDRSENVMIVDLLRNDLSRVAKIGSVQVPKLFTIETYPTVFQMTSTIEAEIELQTSIVDLFTALFPCGSITGAPKVSTMDLIHQLEPDPREIYCGAVGFIEPNGEAVFNVAIRTVVIDKETGVAEYGVGGGITWDSTATGEYEEVLAKAQLLTEDVVSFELLESIKLDNGKYVLLERHMERLASSATYFGYDVNVDEVLRRLEEHAQLYPNHCQKVRLLISRNGKIKINFEDLINLGNAPKYIRLAEKSVSRHNKFLFHKTTNRKVYEAHKNVAQDVYDVLLWNEEGELTEFINGNLVVEIDGQLYTPPLQSGLLAGTFRAQLLEEEKISERILTLNDYEKCHRLWFINSVRGWVEVWKKEK